MNRRQLLWSIGLLPVTQSAAVRPARNTASAEQQIHTLVNRERVRRGLPALHWDDVVGEVARGHSLHMAHREFFAHQDPSGGDLRERLQRGRVTWTRCGENLFREQGYPDVAESALDGWLESPGHYSNIVQPDFTHTGIGVAVSRNETFYITQVFIRRAEISEPRRAGRSY